MDATPQRDVDVGQHNAAGEAEGELLRLHDVFRTGGVGVEGPQGLFYGGGFGSRNWFVTNLGGICISH